jgi:Flp pilus assembly protein TadD
MILSGRIAVAALLTALTAALAFGHISAAESAPGSAPSPQASPPELAPQPPAQTRQQKLDDIFARLAASTDPDETNGLIVAIDRIYLESGSNTGDFLMARAIAALGTRNLDVAHTLLDRIVILQPDWAEAWNKRATVRFMQGDARGSMADIARVLALEPRHVGALTGMGMILEQSGFREEALRAYRRALEIAPQLASARTAADRVEAAIKGQSL